MGTPSEITTRIMQELVARAPEGLTTSELLQLAGEREAARARKALDNLRSRGKVERHAAIDCGATGSQYRWFATESCVAESGLSLNDAMLNKQIERARALDRRFPLVHYGAGLAAPRCNSVWSYARHFTGGAHA